VTLRGNRPRVVYHRVYFMSRYEEIRRYEENKLENRDLRRYQDTEKTECTASFVDLIWVVLHVIVKALLTKLLTTSKCKSTPVRFRLQEQRREAAFTGEEKSNARIYAGHAVHRPAPGVSRGRMARRRQPSLHRSSPLEVVDPDLILVHPPHHRVPPMIPIHHRHPAG